MPAFSSSVVLAASIARAGKNCRTQVAKGKRQQTVFTRSSHSRSQIQWNQFQCCGVFEGLGLWSYVLKRISLWLASWQICLFYHHSSRFESLELGGPKNSYNHDDSACLRIFFDGSPLHVLCILDMYGLSIHGKWIVSWHKMSIKTSWDV